MFAYVKMQLEEANMIKPTNPHHQFRDRYMHSYRVYKWAQRLAKEYPNCNLDVLYTASIFHDVGYAIDKHNHAFYSAKIFKAYAADNNLDKELVEKASYVIMNHSDKSLLKTSDNIELILLLEADLLDEEGSLGILWDLMAYGSDGADTYYLALDEISKHSAHILSQDFMVTPLAKMYWNKKKELVKNFIESIRQDLFLDD